MNRFLITIRPTHATGKGQYIRRTAFGFRFFVGLIESRQS
ncbi:hypothetical protein DESC_600065 [Desulfosarcina cetonica]|nr:hypothetical protein DESC_600065 [Desulfosarcina cetonica]